jgi:uncharacterized protein with HEPN domain
MSYGDFTRYGKTQAAVVWQICVIGEAANQVSPSIRLRAPEIPWRRMIDMRNKLIHDYYEIRLEETWRTVQGNLPPLVDSIKRLLEDLTAEGR